MVQSRGVKRIAPYAKAIAAFAAPLLAGVLMRALPTDVDVSNLELLIVAVLTSGATFAVPNKPKEG